MGEKMMMEWSEVEFDEAYPALHSKGLAVIVTLAGERIFAHAASQRIHLYNRETCMRAIFYKMTDIGLFSQIDLSPVIITGPPWPVEIPF